MAMKKGLGRGLDALFESYNEEPKEITHAQSSIEEIRIMDIDPNPQQPRKHFDDDKIQELANSIMLHGVVQPIVVKQNGNRYMIIAGERRWRAARVAGKATIPAIRMDLDDKQIAEIGLIENLQREDLDPIEEAQGIRILLEHYSLTQEEIAGRLGRSRPAIANSLRLLNLSNQIQKYLTENKITAGHARALLSIADLKIREEIAKQIIERDLNVRDTERLIKSITETHNKKIIKKDKPSYITEIEAGLEESLGTKVQITPGAKKGIIEIEYYSNEDLERIIDRVAIKR